MSNGTLVPIGLSMANGKTVPAEIIAETDKSDIEDKEIDVSYTIMILFIVLILKFVAEK